MKKTALFLAVVVMTVGRSLAQVYNWSTIAGVAGSTNSNDGSGSAARFNHPYSLAVDGGGNVYVTDTFNLRIRKAALAGGNWLVSTIWTNSTGSQGITVGPDGNLYLTDWACRVLRLGLVGTNSGMTVIAGGSAYGSADGTNGAAQFGGPEGLVADGAGTIYVADTQNHTIRKVAPVGTNWVVTTIAGSAGSQGTNDGVGSSARFNWPTGIAVDSSGILYVADQDNYTIRKLTLVGGSWVVKTIAGLAGSLGSVDGTNGSARFEFPADIVADTNGCLFVADSISCTIRKLAPAGTNWVVSTVGGLPSSPGSSNGTNGSARFQNPYGVAVGGGSAVYVADTYNDTIRLGMPLPSGALQVTLSPSALVSAGARWQVDGGVWQDSGATVSGIVTGSHTVAFSTVGGWDTPGSQSVTINANQTTTVTGTYVQQLGSLQFALAPDDAISAGAQWQADAGAWQNNGATVSGLTVGNHVVAFSSVIGWLTPPAQIVAVNRNQTTFGSVTYVGPHAATAIAAVTNGFVVLATITDGGYGYTHLPTVRIVGGGGSGAQATATVSNGVVIAINIINAGFGYTGTPTIVISPPFVRPPVLAIARAVFLTFTGASTGTNYQLQAFRDGVSWTNVGEAFTANAETYNQYVDGGAGSASYRLALWPVPYAASATAQVAYGFVVGVTLGGGGYGYVSAPTVRITGGGGNGAQATTTISNGMVTAVNVLDAGYGYSSAPTVEIDAPPVVALTPTVSKAVRLDCTRLEANLNYQLLASPDFVNWTNCAGPFTATAGTNSEYVGSETGLLFFRLQYVP